MRVFLFIFFVSLISCSCLEKYPKTDLLEFMIDGSFYPKKIYPNKVVSEESIIYDVARFCYEKAKEEDKYFPSYFPLEKINVKVFLYDKNEEVIFEDFIRAFNAGSNTYEIDHYVPYKKEATMIEIKSFMDDNEGVTLFLEKFYTKEELIKGVPKYKYDGEGCHSRRGNRMYDDCIGCD